MYTHKHVSVKVLKKMYMYVYICTMLIYIYIYIYLCLFVSRIQTGRNELWYVHSTPTCGEKHTWCCHLDSNFLLTSFLDGLASQWEDVVLFNMTLFLLTCEEELPWDWTSGSGAAQVPAKHANTNWYLKFCRICMYLLAVFLIRTSTPFKAKRGPNGIPPPL